MITPLLSLPFARLLCSCPVVGKVSSIIDGDNVTIISSMQFRRYKTGLRDTRIIYICINGKRVNKSTVIKKYSVGYF